MCGSRKIIFKRATGKTQSGVGKGQNFLRSVRTKSKKSGMT